MFAVLHLWLRESWVLLKSEKRFTIGTRFRVGWFGFGAVLVATGHFFQTGRCGAMYQLFRHVSELGAA